MNIPDKAVEAAARERYERIYPLRKWDNASDHVQGNFRREAGRALDAAAPSIAAQALRDAAEDILTGSERMKKNLGLELSERNGHMFGTRALIALKLHQRADGLDPQ